ncbi:MAG: DNA (cytosine-5-)-methyltransferase [Methanobacterium sp.]
MSEILKAKLIELDNAQKDIIRHVINNKSFLEKFNPPSEIIDDENVNFLLLINDDRNISIFAHEFIIRSIIYNEFFKNSSISSKKLKNYFHCLKPKKIENLFIDIKLPEIVQDLDKEAIIKLIELFHIKYLNSKLEYRSGRLLKAKGKINLREKGAVYTKNRIAKEITVKTIENKLKDENPSNLRILDFGCGTGRFYMSALVHLTESRNLDVLDVISKNLFAIDLDPIALDILKIKVLNYLGVYEENVLEILNKNLVNKNMLILNKDQLGGHNLIDYEKDFPETMEKGGFNVIISNPPYYLLKVNKKGENNLLQDHYNNLRQKVQRETQYFRESSFYKYSIEGMLNYYKISIEMMLNIAAEGAEIGIICPSTLFGDLSSKKIREWILKKNKLREIDHFPEAAKLFENVTQSTVIFHMKKGDITDKIKIRVNGESFHISLNTITDSFGENLEIPLINRVGWDILKKLSKFKKLKDFSEIRNKRGELDLTHYKKCITKEDTGWRLVRGNMIKKEGIIDANNEFVLIDQFLQKKSKEYKEKDFGKIRLVCQQISNVDIPKRLKFVYSNENDILANSCNYINSSDEKTLEKLFHLLNSIILNWRFKISSSNNHINNYELAELPIIDLNQITSFGNDELETNILIAKLYGLNTSEIIFILKDFFDDEKIRDHMGNKKIIHNHLAPGFSDLEWQMVENIPPGGNWKDIPETVPSKRLAQIRKSGGRTTYYGRLRNDKPSYTISTYFNRIGNGCHIHPEQERLISIREGARLQSFRDSFVFHGSKTSQYKQIGNAVPPLLARAVAECIDPYLDTKSFIDLFAGAGGMSEGFIMQGFNLLGAIEIEKHFFETFLQNHKDFVTDDFILGDITERANRKKLESIKLQKEVDVVVGGPPCQGYSTAGCRNPDDERNQLFKYFVEIVDAIRPEFFIMENVPGITSMSKGAVVKEIKESFKDIGYYLNEPFKLKAEEYGVPQRRRRVFFIGSLKKIKIDPPQPLFSEKDPDLPNPITVKEAIGNLPPLKAGEGDLRMTTQLKSGSRYEELMMGEISFWDFYKSMSKTSQ